MKVHILKEDLKVLNLLSLKQIREVASKKIQELEILFVFFQHSFSTMLQVLKANRDSVTLLPSLRE